MGTINSIRNIISVGVTSKWYILFATLVLAYLLVWLNRNFGPNSRNKYEGFANGQTKTFVTKTGDAVYDAFYTEVYDELFFQPNKLDYEIATVIKEADLAPNKTNMLDIGSGRGHFVDNMRDRGFTIAGVDKSSAMVASSKAMYPNSDFKQGDAMNQMLYPAENFTVITCLSFTVYYIQDKRQFFENCYYWLAPGGYLVVHLVDRNNFDPIAAAGKPYFLISPQSMTDKRITKTVVKFETFQYKSDFNLKTDDDGVLVETFTDDSTGKIRQNIHNYDMPSHKKILKVAKETGFVVSGEVDLVKSMNEYQYLYILKKPN